ncbi:MAG: small conductance mechanosensitive channel [Roseivirga sp.]|jgi:small conductance mechanosensitive channel
MKFDLSQALTIVEDKLDRWLQNLTSLLPNIVVSIIILVIFYFLSRGVRVAAKKLLRRIVDQETIVNLLSTVLSFLTLGTGLIISLNLLHLSQAVTSLLTGAGIMGLAIGFAFQDISANFISGIFMAFKRPINVGDIIDTNGHMGFVREIQLRATTLETFTGLHVIIPNRMIFQNPMTNYTKTYRRRVDLEVGVSYADDLEKVKEITEKALVSNQYLTDEKEIRLVFQEFGSSSINFRIMFWINYSPNSPNYLEARSDAVIAIRKAFNAHDITIPFPIRTLDFGIKGGETLKEQIAPSNS